MERVKVILGLGSDLGNRKNNLELAKSLLKNAFECTIKSSPIYQAEAWGFESESLFLNCCVVVETDLPPKKVLKVTQEIEKKMGRVKKSKNKTYHSRKIDIDILYYGECIISTEKLQVPHPLIYDRSFVVKPLRDVCPSFVDPVKKESISTIFEACNDKSEVLLYEE